MDLMIEHGADVNAQVTGTKTYSMRVSRAPPRTKACRLSMSRRRPARADLVRYLLEKERIPSSPMPTAASRSIADRRRRCSGADSSPRECLLLLRNALDLVQVAAVLEVEPSPQPRRDSRSSGERGLEEVIYLR